MSWHSKHFILSLSPRLQRTTLFRLRARIRESSRSMHSLSACWLECLCSRHSCYHRHRSCSFACALILRASTRRIQELGGEGREAAPAWARRDCESDNQLLASALLYWPIVRELVWRICSILHRAGSVDTHSKFPHSRVCGDVDILSPLDCDLLCASHRHWDSRLNLCGLAHRQTERVEKLSE